MNNSLFNYALLVVVSLLFGITPDCFALNGSPSQFGVWIQGRAETSVTTPVIRLGDIAEITGKDPSFDHDLIALKKIEILKSPPPGKSVTIPGGEVVARLRAQEVDFTKVSYRLPQELRLTRAGRELSTIEVEDAIKSAVKRDNRDAVLKNVELPPVRTVFAGPITLEADFRGTAFKGRTPCTLRLKSPAGEEMNLEVLARFDEYADIPVARRPLGRGDIVNEDDVVMARLNLGQMPSGFVESVDRIYGLEIKQPVSQGEPFSRGDLVVPPVIKKGEGVRLVFRTALLEASASGTALGSGIVGDLIEVRNISSLKVVQGTVFAPGVVKVGP